MKILKKQMLYVAVSKPDGQVTTSEPARKVAARERKRQLDVSGEVSR